MSVKITRDEWNRALAGRSISVKDASADSRLAGIDVTKADLDGDGEIKGARETSALFTEVDKIDHDQNSNSIELVDKDGKLTALQKPAEAIGELGKAADIQRKARSQEPGNDDVLFVGMRSASSLEKQNMKALAKAHGFKLTEVGSASSIVENGGKTFDLSKADGRKDFAASLGLSKEQTDQVQKVLDDALPDGRDELAEIAKDWAKAEKGGQASSRLVISGHHAFDTFWGENGWIEEGDLAALAKAMPKGAAQVEDLHLAGCYTGGYQAEERWRAILSGVQTIWGYQHSSPVAGASNGQQTEWEAQSRGRVGILDRTRARGSLAEEVTVWSQQGGHVTKDGEVALSEVKDGVAAKKSAYEDAFSGKKVFDPHSGALREYYNALNNLANHPDASDAERADAKDKIERTIRLLYFKDVAKGWAGENKEVIDKGYAATKLTKPDFSKMDRPQALKAIDEYMKATEGSKDKDVLALRAEMTALHDLDPAKLKKSWIP